MVDTDTTRHVDAQRPLRIALIQQAPAIPPTGDLQAALVTGEAAVRAAAGMGADIALFPEMWSTGYVDDAPSADVRADTGTEADDDPWHTLRAWLAERAVARTSAWVQHFAALAREVQMAIAITYLEAWPGPGSDAGAGSGGPRNTVTVFDRHGREVLTYAKVHTCAFDAPECWLTPGDDFPVATLDTAAGPVQIGAMICYDREFPESARLLMLGGAEVVLVPNACEMEANRLGQLRARAYENMLVVALANYPAPLHGGHSVAYDPFAFDGPDGASRDTTLVLADAGPAVVLATVDLPRLRAYRAAETWGNAFRRPRTYGALTALDVAEPFVRTDPRHGRRWER